MQQVNQEYNAVHFPYVFANYLLAPGQMLYKKSWHETIEVKTQ